MDKKNTNENNTCLICWEQIDNQDHCCRCFICNIILHDVCEETYRGQKKYCECPHCRRIGTIYKKN